MDSFPKHALANDLFIQVEHKCTNEFVPVYFAPCHFSYFGLVQTDTN